MTLFESWLSEISPEFDLRRGGQTLPDFGFPWRTHSAWSRFRKGVTIGTLRQAAADLRASSLSAKRMVSFSKSTSGHSRIWIS